MVTGGFKRVYIVVLGVVLAIIVGVGVYFAAIKPASEQLTEVQGETEGYVEKINTKPTVMKALAKAKFDQTQKRIDLLRYEDRYMRIGPERAFLSVKDRQAAMILLWKEQAYTLGPLINKYLRSSGVKLLTAIQVPGAPVDPNAINPIEYEIPLGQIQVSGSFQQINRFLNSVRNAPRLIRVDNVELAGESPNVTATMTLTVILLPRDSDKASNVPLATGDTGGGGGPTGSYGGAPPPGGPSGYGGGTNGAGGTNGT